MARITAAEVIVAVVVAGAAVADVIVADARRAQVAAICLRRNTPLRKVASLAATIRVATTIAAATSGALKIVAASRAVLSLGVPSNAALIIAVRRLPVLQDPPLAAPWKSPFFFQASLSPNTVASPSPLPRRSSWSPNITSRSNPKLKTPFRVHPLGKALPSRPQDLDRSEAMFPVVSLAGSRDGFSQKQARKLRSCLKKSAPMRNPPLLRRYR